MDNLICTVIDRLLRPLSTIVPLS